MSDIPTWAIWIGAAALLLLPTALTALAVFCAKAGTGQERAAGRDYERDAYDAMAEQEAP